MIRKERPKTWAGPCTVTQSVSQRVGVSLRCEERRFICQSTSHMSYLVCHNNLSLARPVLNIALSFMLPRDRLDRKNSYVSYNPRSRSKHIHIFLLPACFHVREHTQEEERHLQLQFHFRFTRDLEEVFFAFCFPYSYEECQRDLDHCEGQVRIDLYIGAAYLIVC